MGAPLSDLENECLALGQWPGINPGGTPTWANAGQFNQALVDYALNKGYRRVMSDISGLEIFLVTDTQRSVANQSLYKIPYQPNNNPVISTVHRVYYAPQGGPSSTYFPDSTASTSSIPNYPFLLTKSLAGAPTSITTTITASLTQTLGWVTAANDPNLTTWPAGSNLNVVINVLSQNANLTITQVQILRVNAAASSSLTTVATSTVSQSLANSGVYTFPMTWALTNTNATDRLIVSISVTNAAGTNQSFVWQGGINTQSSAQSPFTGVQFTREFGAQLEFKSWNDWQRESSLGMVVPYAFTQRPTYTAVSPDRTSLAFLPGSSATGDIITMQYTPLPTVGAAICPTLVAETDTTVLSTDYDECIVMWAMWILWQKARQPDLAKQSKADYLDEMKRLINVNQQSSTQDSISVTNMSPYDDDYLYAGEMGVW